MLSLQSFYHEIIVEAPICFTHESIPVIGFYFHVTGMLSVLWELCVAKFKISFIGRSASNHSAFYLYSANSASSSSTLVMCMCDCSRRCSLRTVISVTCSIKIQGSTHISERFLVWKGFLCHMLGFISLLQSGVVKLCYVIYITNLSDWGFIILFTWQSWFPSIEFTQKPS